MLFDEVQRLRECDDLHALLDHYVRLGREDRDKWQDRLMALDGVEPRDLARLHGELIAYAWVEQNTGVTTAGQPGRVAGCYRVTAAGRRALKQARVERAAEEAEVEAA